MQGPYRSGVSRHGAPCARIAERCQLSAAPVFLRLDAAPLPRRQRLDDAPLEVREIVAHDPGPNVWERKSLFEFRV